jgi:hypothetical protein
MTSTEGVVAILGWVPHISLESIQIILNDICLVQSKKTLIAIFTHGVMGLEWWLCCVDNRMVQNHLVTGMVNWILLRPLAGTLSG